MNLFSANYTTNAGSNCENTDALLVQSRKKYTLFLLSMFLFLLPILSHAQYTETINSNRPGNSQGAFSLGTGVFQFEAGGKIGASKHSLRNTETDLWGIDYAIRAGVWREQLEISIMGSFLSKNEKLPPFYGDNYTNHFEFNTIGAKYLLYDPYKRADEKEPNLYSWRANQRSDWSKLIPAVSLYAGLNLATSDNPYLDPGQGPISPKVAIITQNNFEGGWVFVLNLIGDKLSEEFPSYIGIATLTHSFNEEFAAFAEFQTIISDIYSDEFARAGLAYLVSKDFQIDVSGLINFKDTPSKWQFAVGASYRFDFHEEQKQLQPDQPQQEPASNL